MRRRPCEQRLLSALRALPARTCLADEDRRPAQLHGVASVLMQPQHTSASDELYRSAQALEHEAHMAWLRKIDEVLTTDTLQAVVLKGPLFAARYYEDPTARNSSDIDLLVLPTLVVPAAHALARLGYRADEHELQYVTSSSGHHVHLTHDTAPPIELHFHAYQGFGCIMHSLPLLERSVAAERFGSLRVLGAPDELVYLSVHAAAHRFGRLGWLYDLKLLVDRMTNAELCAAAKRARQMGFERACALAVELLCEELGCDQHRLLPLLEHMQHTTMKFARHIALEPSTQLARSATRLLYSMALAPSPRAAARCAISLVRRRASPTTHQTAQ